MASLLDSLPGSFLPAFCSMGTNFFKDINNISITGGHFSMNPSPVYNTDSRRQTIHEAPVYQHDNRGQTIYRAPVHRIDNSGQTIYNAPVHETDNREQTKYFGPVYRTDNTGQKIYHGAVHENDNRDQTIYRGEVRYDNNGGHHGSVSDHYFQPSMNSEPTRNPRSGPYWERDDQRDRNTGLQAPYPSRENGYRTPPPHGNGPYPTKSHTFPNPRGQAYLSPPLTPYNSATNEAREREAAGNYSGVKQASSSLGFPPVSQNIEEPADLLDEQIYGVGGVYPPDSDGKVLAEEMARLLIDESKSKMKKPATASNTPHPGHPYAWGIPSNPEDTPYSKRSTNPFRNPYPSPESSSRDTRGPSFDFPSPFNTTNTNSNNKSYTTIQGSFNDNSTTTTKISKAGGKKRRE